MLLAVDVCDADVVHDCKQLERKQQTAGIALQAIVLPPTTVTAAVDSFTP
jgi:hypothetical protein